MEIENTVICGTNLKKAYKGFQLDIPELKIPKGYATALIGENGAGKTTLLNMMTGIRQDFTGKFEYFDEKLGINDKNVKQRIGFMGPNNYFLPHWTIRQVVTANELLFDTFRKERFYEVADALSIPVGNVKDVKSLSDGNKMKLMLAGLLTRKTETWIMDEPASPLDPLMRDKLCEIISDYLSNEDGKRSVFFSTHDIADMENITDYAIIMEKGSILEQGFVEDLREKYILVNGDNEDYDKVAGYLIGGHRSKIGFQGMCLSKNLEVLSGTKVECETPSLHQICIAVMKEKSKLKAI